MPNFSCDTKLNGSFFTWNSVECLGTRNGPALRNVGYIAYVCRE